MDKTNLSDTLEWQRTGTTSFITFELKHLYSVTEEIMTRNFKQLQNNKVEIKMGKFLQFVFTIAAAPHEQIRGVDCRLAYPSL